MESANGKFIKEKTLVFVLLGSLLALEYIYIDRYNSVVNSNFYQVLKFKIDEYIPFIPGWVFFYFMYYFWHLWLLYIIRTREQLYFIALSFVFTSLLAGITFVLFPTHMPRRELLAIPELFRPAFRLLYVLDKGYNLLPSLHTAQSFLIAWFAKKYLEDKRLVRLISFGSLLVIASTVLIKQHFFIDIPAGILYAYAGIYLASATYRKITRYEYFSFMKN